MSSKLSDIGFRILTTNDFLFGFLGQLLLLIWMPVVTQEIGFATIRCNAHFWIFALTKTFLTSIQRCSECYEMSNKIALVSLDFARTGSMCGGNKRS
jgi:hypothetical protein